MKLRLLSLVAAAAAILVGGAARAQDAPACDKLTDGPRVRCLLGRVDAHLSAGNHDAATPLAFDALELTRGVGDPGLSYAAHVQLGRLYSAKADQTNAMRQFVQALKIADQESRTAWVTEAKTHIGETFTALEDFAQAESNFMEALVLAQAEKDWARAAQIHGDLGEVYLAQGIIGKSQENLRKALDLYVEDEDFEAAAGVSGKLADQYYAAADYDNAERYAEQTVQLHASVQDLPAIADDNRRLARIYAAFEDYEGAIEVTETAFGLYKRTESVLGEAAALRDFADYYAELGDDAAARENAAEAIALLETVDGAEGFEISRDLAGLYERLGDPAAALIAQRDFVERREAFFAGEKNRALLELTTRYQSEFATEQQQRRIELLERDEAQSARLRFFLIVVVLMIGALAANLFVGNRRKRRDNRLLQQKNEEIGRQKAEIDLKNLELAENNDKLASLNAKLVDEMAERESIQKTSFARDRFLATMSHEMRTPINIISGLCHLLIEENPRADQVEHLRTLQFSANNLVVFINDILDFSKIEAGKLNLEKREFSPRRVFQEIETRFETAARDKAIEATYSFDDAIPDCLMGDPARFNQIITNLVTTSFAHSVSSKVHIAMRIEELRKEETMLRFEIEDEGQVLDKKQLESMFRSFTYNPDDVFEGYNSSDLVLAITRRLVDLQNGHIEVQPREAGGNRFTVLLKFRVVNGRATRKRAGGTQAFQHLAGNQLLLVEDNKINQLVVQKMLTRLGIQVTTADNGLEALEILNHRTFDLCLMDIQMPKMDGYRATAEIRKHVNPAVRDIPVIALTASAFLSEREKAKLFGMNDHVGKPFAPEELLDKISTSLAIYRGEISESSATVTAEPAVAVERPSES